MTAIVGLVEDGKVWIGGDSAGTAGLSSCIRSDEKVWRSDMKASRQVRAVDYSKGRALFSLELQGNYDAFAHAMRVTNCGTFAF